MDVIRTDTAVFCLVSLARFHGLAADSAQIKHQFTDSATHLDDNELLRAAKFLKLKARKIKVNVSSLDRIPLPAIAQHADGHYFIIARVHDGKTLIQDPLKGTPETVSFDVLESLLGAHVFLMTKRSLLPGVRNKFDFSWFIPAILGRASKTLIVASGCNIAIPLEVRNHLKDRLPPS